MSPGLAVGICCEGHGKVEKDSEAEWKHLDLLAGFPMCGMRGSMQASYSCELDFSLAGSEEWDMISP